jgi:hypothetical protein
MKKDLLKHFNSLHQKVEVKEADHIHDGRTNSELNLGAGAI